MLPSLTLLFLELEYPVLPSFLYGPVTSAEVPDPRMWGWEPNPGPVEEQQNVSLLHRLSSPAQCFLRLHSGDGVSPPPALLEYLLF